MREFWGALTTLIQKDIRLELRNKEILVSMLLYTVLAGVIFAFSFEKIGGSRPAFFAGVLWVTVTFAGTLGMGRLASREEENNALLGLVLAPSSRAALYFAKALVAFFLMAFLILCEVPLFAFLFSVEIDLGQAFWVFASVLCGALGFALVGTITSSLLLGAKGRELLLPVALYPLALPVIIAGASATVGFLSPVEGIRQSAFGTLNILLVFDIIYAIVGGNLYEQLLVE